MRIDELHKTSLSDFRKYLGTFNDQASGTDIWSFFQERGFQYEGQGSFGVVMSHPKLNYVIKLYDTTDKGYPAFLQFVKDYGPSKYLPKFIGKPMKVEGQLYALRMEKLSNDIPSHFEFGPLQRVMTRPDEDSILNANWHYDDALVDVVVALSKYAREHKISHDLRYGNLLMRGETPVIIDPYVKY